MIDPSASIVLQWGTGTDAIYKQRADGSDRTQISDVPGSALHPDVSPDGSQIAFKMSDAKDQIWIATASGAEAKALVTCEEDSCFGTDYPAWSPDGNSIVYTSYLAPPDDNSPPAGSTLRVINIETNKARVVASSKPGEILDNARWSPDGTSLVFQIDHFDSSGTETASFVASTPVAGGAVTRITDGEMFGAYPDWNRTDGRIVFVTYDLGPFETLPDRAASNLYTIEPDGSGLTQLTDLPPNGDRVTQPTWTLNGAGVLVTAVAKDGSRKPAVVPGDGGDVISLATAPATHVREAPAP